MDGERTSVDIARNAAGEVALFIEPRSLRGEVALVAADGAFLLRDEAGLEVPLDVPAVWADILPGEPSVLVFEFDTRADRLVSERTASVVPPHRFRNS